MNASAQREIHGPFGDRRMRSMIPRIAGIMYQYDGGWPAIAGMNGFTSGG